MTAFTDLLDLQTAVVEHVRDASIADVMPRLVKLAEADFNKRLRCREQMSTSSLVVSGGSAALPADFQEVIGVYNGAGNEYIQQPLQALAMKQQAGYYAISGSYLVSKADETLKLDYYAKIPTISGNMTDSNWLLQKHPKLYLYGVGLEAAKYLRDVETAQVTSSFLEEAYQAASAEDAGQRFSRARVRVQGSTP